MFWNQIESIISKNEHCCEPMIRLDNMIVCRICGKLLPEIVVEKHRNYYLALAGLVDIGIKEGYSPANYNWNSGNKRFPVFIKDCMELTIIKRGIMYEIVKRLCPIEC